MNPYERPLCLFAAAGAREGASSSELATTATSNWRSPCLGAIMTSCSGGDAVQPHSTMWSSTSAESPLS